MTHCSCPLPVVSFVRLPVPVAAPVCFTAQEDIIGSANRLSEYQFSILAACTAAPTPPEARNEASEFSRVHAHRTAGRCSDHRGAGGAAVSGARPGPRQGAANNLSFPHKATGPRDHAVCPG